MQLRQVFLQWLGISAAKTNNIYIFGCYKFAKKTCPVMRRGYALTLLFIFVKERTVYIMRENKFQAKLIQDIKKMFPGCMVMKTDPNYIQGIPDLLILHNDKWASLECKKTANANKQPNQEYYVEKMNDMSFSRFIYPQNKEEVLDELRRSFEA